MTDKQIIIDGCDVSGCEYCSRYPDTTVYNCDWIGECKEHPNCHYKQLKRAEKTMQEIWDRLGETSDKLLLKEQECEEWRKVANITRLKRINSTISRKNLKLKLDQLKQTLAEIKPILELYANSKVGEEQPDGTYKLSGGIWDSFGFCTTTYDPRPAREGLKKISEVEDG